MREERKRDVKIQCVRSCFQAYVHKALASLPVAVFALTPGLHLYLSMFSRCLPADAISTHVVTDDSRCHSLTLRCLMSFLFIN